MKMKENKLYKRLVIFAIAVLLSLGAAGIVNSEIIGSHVTAITAQYTPGTTNVDLQFQTLVFSSDVEWVVYAELDFPTGVYVNYATDMVSGTYTLDYANPTSEMGDGALVTWGDIAGSYTYGYLNNLAVADFTVNVDIDGGFSGDMDLNWFLEGDYYGAPPNTMFGTVTIKPVPDNDVGAINVDPAGLTLTATVPENIPIEVEVLQGLDQQLLDIV